MGARLEEGRKIKTGESKILILYDPFEVFLLSSSKIIK
jgi:hypothetical protein